MNLRTPAAITAEIAAVQQEYREAKEHLKELRAARASAFHVEDADLYCSHLVLQIHELQNQRDLAYERAE